MTLTCARCALVSDDTAHFCEDCGTDLRSPPAVPASSVPVSSVTWLSSAAPGGTCGHCGAGIAASDGYCDECGRRRGVALDRADLALHGVAAVTDRGRHRHHNEDAVALGTGDAVDGGTAAIVCDGVSSSPRADAAAVAACDAGLPVLLRAIGGGVTPEDATRDAYEEAFLAVDALVDTVPADAPSCTYVSGIVTGGGVTVGWVGDSRAYWIPRLGPPRCLTVDDALPDSPGAPLIRWVGADAPGVRIQVVTVEPTAPGSLLLCTDGLSRYLAGPADLAPAAGSSPAEAADRLVRLALDAGGADNVAVAILAFPPGGVTA